MSVEEQEADASNSNSAAVTTTSTVITNSRENGPQSNRPPKENDKPPPLETATPNGHSNGKKSNEEYKVAIRRQIDYYFSKQNLMKDTYLRSMMNADLAVPIASISRFKRMTMICEDIDMLIQLVPQAVQGSQVCQVTADGKGLRPKFKTERNTIILREMPGNMTSTEITDIFKGCGKSIQSVWSDVGDTWFVTMQSEEDALSIMLDIRTRKITHEGQLLKARLKSETGAQTMRAYLTQGFQNGQKPAGPQPPVSVLHGKMGPVPPRARGAPPVHHPPGYPTTQPGYPPAVPMNFSAMGPHGGGPRPQRMHMNGNFPRYNGTGPMPPNQQPPSSISMRMNGSHSTGSLNNMANTSQLNSSGNARPPPTPTYASVSHTVTPHAMTPPGQRAAVPGNANTNRTPSVKGNTMTVTNGTAPTDNSEKAAPRVGGGKEPASSSNLKKAQPTSLEPGLGITDESALSKKKKNKKDAAKQRTVGATPETPPADITQTDKDNRKSPPPSSANEVASVKGVAPKVKGKMVGAVEKQPKDKPKAVPGTRKDILNAADFPALPTGKKKPIARQAKAPMPVSKQAAADANGVKEKKMAEPMEYSTPFIKYSVQDMCRIGMIVKDSAKMREELKPEVHGVILSQSPRPGLLMPEENDFEEAMGPLFFGSLEENKTIEEIPACTLNDSAKQCSKPETSKQPDKPLGAWASAVVKGNGNGSQHTAEPSCQVVVSDAQGKEMDIPKEPRKPVPTSSINPSKAVLKNSTLKDLDTDKKQPTVWGGQKRSFLDVVKTADQKRNTAASGSA